MRAAVLPVLAIVAAATAATAAAQAPVPTPAPAPTATPVPAPEPTIAAGIGAAGVDLSNQTITQAQATLQAAYGRAARAPVVVSVAGRRFTLRARRVRLRFDPNRTARRAFHAGLDTPPAPGRRLDVPLAIEFARRPIRAFVAAAARAVFVPARDATVHIAIRRVTRRHSHKGRALPAKRLDAAIERALADPRRPRVLRPGRKVVQPKVVAKDLPGRYAAILTIDRATFRLRYFHRLKRAKTYRVAVGQPAYPTPTGLFAIQDKQVNPTWTAPNSPWAGELAGQSISPGDPSNPLKARWMGIVNGVGIHGTGQESSIGSAASHGCIRMRVRAVIDLYRRVPVGSPVLIR